MQCNYLIVSIGILFSSPFVFAQNQNLESSTSVEQLESPAESIEIKIEFPNVHTDNQLKVDGTASSNIEHISKGVAVSAELNKYEIALSLKSINREIEDLRAKNEFQKETDSYGIDVAIPVTETLFILAGFEQYNTFVRRTGNSIDNYDLNTKQVALGTRILGDKNTYDLLFFTEALSSQKYEVFGYQMVDRDYIPAHVDFKVTRPISTNWSVEGFTRYSHYNHDVYKEQYGDESIPSSPTVRQVFDYLLTFQLSTAYEITNKWEISATIKRKAALDVNTYLGDEYVLAYYSGLDTEFMISKNISLNAGVQKVNGVSDHEVLGKIYHYENDSDSYHLAANILF